MVRFLLLAILAVICWPVALIILAGVACFLLVKACAYVLVFLGVLSVKAATTAADLSHQPEHQN